MIALLSVCCVTNVRFLNVRAHREAMSRMKEGEEEKTKSYTALVWTQKPIQEEDLTFIDDIKVP